MQESSICKATEHLFLPVLEVYDPLLRCIHCNVFAYHETVKQMAKNRSSSVAESEPVIVQANPDLIRLWMMVWRSWPSVFWRKFAHVLARAAH